MRILFSLLLVFAVNLFAFTWAKSFDDAKQEAKVSGKSIMLVLTQHGCDSCEYMKNIVFKEASVSDTIDSRFIPVEIDVKTGIVPTGFKVFGVPTIYFLDANGNKIARQFVGMAKSDAFLDLLRKIGK